MACRTTIEPYKPFTSESEGQPGNTTTSYPCLRQFVQQQRRHSRRGGLRCLQHLDCHRHFTPPGQIHLQQWEDCCTGSWWEAWLLIAQCAIISTRLGHISKSSVMSYPLAFSCAMHRSAAGLTPCRMIPALFPAPSAAPSSSAGPLPPRGLH